MGVECLGGWNVGLGDGWECLGRVLDVLLVVVLVLEELLGLELDEVLEMQWLGRRRCEGGGVGRDGDLAVSLNLMSVQAKTGGGGGGSRTICHIAQSGSPHSLDC